MSQIPLEQAAWAKGWTKGDSTSAPNWVWDALAALTNASDARVLSAVARRAGYAQNVLTTAEVIYRTGLDQRTAQSALARLRDAGFIVSLNGEHCLAGARAMPAQRLQQRLRKSTHPKQDVGQRQDEKNQPLKQEKQEKQENDSTSEQAGTLNPPTPSRETRTTQGGHEAGHAPTTPPPVPPAPLPAENDPEALAVQLFTELCGQRFVNTKRGHLRRWYTNHGPAFIRAAWDAAQTVRPTKRPVFNLEDLLNGQLALPDALVTLKRQAVTPTNIPIDAPPQPARKPVRFSYASIIEQDLKNLHDREAAHA